ncbi:hypothetical protein [Nonomuraea sp. bgisy101]|uniref:hypothetical protein n=1 Tax=Nonomuraea sp. bgisy101 TaxID=3413784 RepID=UPI003D72B3AC
MDRDRLVSFLRDGGLVEVLGRAEPKAKIFACAPWRPGCMLTVVSRLPDPLPEFFDCGCPDVYYCPRAGEVECPRHSGFDVCCDALDQHIPIRV